MSSSSCIVDVDLLSAVILDEFIHIRGRTTIHRLGLTGLEDWIFVNSVETNTASCECVLVMLLSETNV